MKQEKDPKLIVIAGIFAIIGAVATGAFLTGRKPAATKTEQETSASEPERKESYIYVPESTEAFWTDYRETKYVEEPETVQGISDEETEKLLQEAAFSRAEKVEREAGNGDAVWYDQTVKISGVKIPGLSFENTYTVIGEDEVYPGFDTKLVGCKAGEDLNFKIKLPDEYPDKNLRNRVLEFSIHINEVREIPKIDSAMISEITDGKAGSKEEYKEMIDREREDYQKEFRILATAIRKYNDLVEGSSIDVPKDIYNRYLERYKKEAEKYCRERGLTMDQYLERFRMSESKYEEKGKEEAEQNGKKYIIENQIIQDNHIEPSAEHHKRFCFASMGYIPDEQEMNMLMSDEDWEERIRYEAVICFLMDTINFAPKT